MLLFHQMHRLCSVGFLIKVWISDSLYTEFTEGTDSFRYFTEKTVVSVFVRVQKDFCQATFRSRSSAMNGIVIQITFNSRRKVA
jgi:hypothetical protein